MAAREPFQISARLITLLRYAKRPSVADDRFTWQSVGVALEDLYHPDINLRDAIHHLTAAYSEALMERRFELPTRSAAEDLLLSPIKGCNAIEILGPASVETKYSIDQFYNAISAYIFGQLQITRIDWCRGAIFPDEAEQVHHCGMDAIAEGDGSCNAG